MRKKNGSRKRDVRENTILLSTYELRKKPKGIHWVERPAAVDNKNGR